MGSLTGLNPSCHPLLGPHFPVTSSPMSLWQLDSRTNLPSSFISAPAWLAFFRDTEGEAGKEPQHQSALQCSGGTGLKPGQAHGKGVRYPTSAHIFQFLLPPVQVSFSLPNITKAPYGTWHGCLESGVFFALALVCFLFSGLALLSS